MTDHADKALLPAGLRDDLPPEAEFEAGVIERLMATFASFGYQRVKPPLIEFEESLLAGPGGGVGPWMFRLMDPVSQRMLGLRADITPQIARIASSRLGNAQRPLRLKNSTNGPIKASANHTDNGCDCLSGASPSDTPLPDDSGSSISNTVMIPTLMSSAIVR